MITGMHSIIHTRDPDETRAFFRDVLEWPSVDRGWGLLTEFDLPGGGRMGLYEPRHPLATGIAPS